MILILNLYFLERQFQLLPEITYGKQLLEFIGFGVVLHTCCSNVSTTPRSGRNTNVCKEYVCVVLAGFLFEIFRGVSHLGADRNTNTYDDRNGTYFLFTKLLNSVQTQSKI